MAQLKKAGFVETKEGTAGGYRFSGNADTLSLSQVAEVLDIRFVDAAWRYSHKWSFLRRDNIERQYHALVDHDYEYLQEPYSQRSRRFGYICAPLLLIPQPGTRLPDDHHEEYRQAE